MKHFVPAESLTSQLKFAEDRPSLPCNEPKYYLETKLYFKTLKFEILLPPQKVCKAYGLLCCLFSSKKPQPPATEKRLKWVQYLPNLSRHSERQARRKSAGESSKLPQVWLQLNCKHSENTLEIDYTMWNAKQQGLAGNHFAEVLSSL